MKLSEHTEMTWVGVVCAAASAVVVPLLLHRIFFFKKVDHGRTAGSCSLEEYMIKVGLVVVQPSWTASHFLYTLIDCFTHGDGLSLCCGDCSTK